MVNLLKAPFELNETQLKWVCQTLDEMTLEEKIGQLFIMLKAQPGVNEAQIKSVLDTFHQGGLRWQGGDKETVYLQNTTYQKNAKIPLLIAANCDNGGDGCLPNEGTFVATAAQAAAHESVDTAYHMGEVSAREATSIGCNWLFNPVADIYLNWRNTIVNTRCFGDNADQVLKNTRAFIQGAKAANPNMACCAKHFPGDGKEELDQHLVLGINDLTVDEWFDSYGKVYKGLIEDGIETIMAGHFALPNMSRYLKPGIKDHEIMPATLAPEIITGLLRDKLGFNGLVLTDATHMIGFSAMKSREEALPLSIAAGCDMILFANDIEEDVNFIKSGIEKGQLTLERLDDAVTRILGLKAKLKLTEESVRIPDQSLLQTGIGTSTHKNYRKLAAQRCTTLVKDTANLLPITSNDKKNILFIYIPSAPISMAYKSDREKEIFAKKLTDQGFNVTVAPSFYDLEVQNGVSPMNMVKMMERGSREQFKEKYDLVFVVFNIKGYAQENVVRVKWSSHHSIEMPWYISEVPTIGISLNLTNHLIDVPQIKTFINAFGSSEENIDAVIEKICGKSPFLGEVKNHYFCDRWEARL